MYELTGTGLIGLAAILGVSGPNFEQVALVQFNGLGGATKVVFESTQAAFEVAFAPVPLPAALPLFEIAIGGLALLRYRRNRGTASAA